MANNIDVIGDMATVGQLVFNNFSATNGRLEDDGVNSLKSYAFNECSALVTAVFPSLTSLKSDGFQFAQCLNLEFADLGYIPILYRSTFTNASKLVSVILRKTDGVCSLGNVNAFDSTKYATSGAGGAYVYVPRDLIPSYQAASNWVTLYNAHTDMFRALEDYTVDGTSTGAFDESKL